MDGDPAAIPADTAAAAWRRQMAAIATPPVAERLEEWEELDRGVFRSVEGAVRRRHPDYDDREEFMAIVRRVYGDELALTVWPEAASVHRVEIAATNDLDDLLGAIGEARVDG